MCVQESTNITVSSIRYAPGLSNNKNSDRNVSRECDISHVILFTSLKVGFSFLSPYFRVKRLAMKGEKQLLNVVFFLSPQTFLSFCFPRPVIPRYRTTIYVNVLRYWVEAQASTYVHAFYGTTRVTFTWGNFKGQRWSSRETEQMAHVAFFHGFIIFIIIIIYIYFFFYITLDEFLFYVFPPRSTRKKQFWKIVRFNQVIVEICAVNITTTMVVPNSINTSVCVFLAVMSYLL